MLAPSVASELVQRRSASPVVLALPAANTATASTPITVGTATEGVHSTRGLYADPEIIAMASSFSTVLTKSLLHPLDTLKCRMQILQAHVPPPNTNCFAWRGLLCTRIRQLEHQYAGQWSPRYLYGGLPVKLAFYLPYQALYMSSYNCAQRMLQGDREEQLKGGTHHSAARVWHTVAAAVFAETASCCLRVPMETVKMRVQSATTASSLHAMVQLWRQGLRSSMRLLVPHTITHDIPYSVIQWVVYETLRPWTQQWGSKPHLPSSTEGPLTVSSFFSRYGAELTRTFFSGGFSGFLASALTVPLDNIRTRTAVATASDPTLTVKRVVRTTYQTEGLSGFMRGGGMRVLWVTMNMAIFYPLFEGTRAILQYRADTAQCATQGRAFR
ncbi:mitochondrial carrier protein-like protein [Leptomonas seymouri]|uniref:Mitochondrial carrier protein-like protein n=1 Tax=Leptomonas seymouri TaxID=5684 RepID=A0A0N1HX21_LEPSE|nr:mitochondrial carrier protein-like protein [Leptomonas seymouri]|eukprot:KPI85645.1 mitochondrial carrier protein-like protein [Leptomonas seymouri]